MLLCLDFQIWKVNIDGLMEISIFINQRQANHENNVSHTSNTVQVQLMQVIQIVQVIKVYTYCKGYVSNNNNNIYFNTVMETKQM